MNASFFLHVCQQICVEEAAEGDGGGGGGGNFIVIVPGANNLLSPEDVAAAIDRHVAAKVVLVSKSSDCQCLETCGFLMERSAVHGEKYVLVRGVWRSFLCMVRLFGAAEDARPGTMKTGEMRARNRER